MLGWRCSIFLNDFQKIFIRFFHVRVMAAITHGFQLAGVISVTMEAASFPISVGHPERFWRDGDRV